MARTLTNITKTRLAPTPSGFLHLGNILSFSITAMLAREYGAKILLRIDDLDQARVNKLYLQDIFDTLNFLNVPWDTGPRDVKDFENNYSQLKRKPLYQQALTRLANEGLVYACTCSRSNVGQCTCYKQNIPLTTLNASWHLLTDNNYKIDIRGYHGDTINAILPAEMHNFLIKKKDGQPAYQLTSVIDDLYFGVDLVVRGHDLWPSTIAQHQLAKALGETRFGKISFYHHTILTNDLGKKLSKSASAGSVNNFRLNSKKPADVFKAIALMLDITTEVNTWEQLAAAVIV